MNVRKKDHFRTVVVKTSSYMVTTKENWFEGGGDRGSVHFAVTFLDCWKTSFCVTQSPPPSIQFSLVSTIYLYNTLYYLRHILYNTLYNLRHHLVQYIVLFTAPSCTIHCTIYGTIFCTIHCTIYGTILYNTCALYNGRRKKMVSEKIKNRSKVVFILLSSFFSLTNGWINKVCQKNVVIFLKLLKMWRKNLMHFQNLKRS